MSASPLPLVYGDDDLLVLDKPAGLLTVLVLSGVTSEPEIEVYPYRPDQVYGSVADLVPLI